MHDHYLKYALNVTELVETQIPFRGEIYDRNKNLLASTKKFFRMYIDKAMFNQLKLSERDSLIKLLCQVTGNSEAVYYSKIFENGSAESGIAYLENDLSFDKHIRLMELKSLKPNRKLLACIGFEKYQKRLYTSDFLAAHVLGYVDKNSQGLDGVEKYYNDILQGKIGKTVYRKDARGFKKGIVFEKSTDAENGYDLELTIDREIQKILEDEIKSIYEDTKAASATGIVVNPNTGEILALTNYPSFNPAHYYKYSDEVRKNKAISVIYDPGSTFKTFTLATALDLSKIKLDTIISAERGIFTVAKNMTITDDHYKFEKLTPAEALTYSSNIVFAKIGKNIGIENFYNSLLKFGFGSLTGIDLPGEVRSKFTLSSNVDDRNVYWISHGYSISVSPLQLVMMYSAIINGGKLLKPFIVKRIINEKEEIVEETKPTVIRQVISENTSQTIRKLLEKVVLDGTGRKAKLEYVSCGGKTGTAVKYFENVGYVKGKYISSFVGFFPVENPEYLILILVDLPKTGYYAAEIAAPVFKKVGDRIWQRDQFIKELKKNKNNDIKYELVKNNNHNKNGFPDLTGFEKNKAIEIAKSFNLEVELRGEGILVVGQIYDHLKNRVIFKLDKSYDTLTKEKNNVTVPQLVGLSKKSAIIKLKSLQVPFEVEGTGYVVHQSIEPGTLINTKTKIKIKCN